MHARRLVPLLLVLAVVAVGATGCFSSKVAHTTIAGEITIGQGSTAETVNVATATGGVSTNPNPPGPTTGGTTGETTTGSTTTGSTTTGGSAGADLAAGKTAFVATCGGCHTLKDAGTTGKVGPDLDSLAPLTAARVANQIAHGGAVMPAKLLTGKDAANVAAYVASVAGK
jgi:mono/diheme cytochrome c family protein